MKKKRYVPPILLLLALLWSPSYAGESPGNGEFVGPEVCKACHPDYFTSYAQSVHSKRAVPGSPANKHACESCHGPGAAHVAKGGGRGTGMTVLGKATGSAEDKSAKCLACHAESVNLPFWDMSRHKLAGISCDRCHSTHTGARNNLRASVPELCNGCHQSIKAQTNRQSHHPIKEGKTKCTECHDQHGGFGEKMVKANSISELCYKCHADKRGPFLWEHPPVAENCLTCHVPHGSNHYKLLVEKAPILCLSCHDVEGHPGNVYSSFETFGGSATSNKNRMFARGCLNCHSNIHGSNGPAARGQYFLR